MRISNNRNDHIIFKHFNTKYSSKFKTIWRKTDQNVGNIYYIIKYGTEKNKL